MVIQHELARYGCESVWCIPNLLLFGPYFNSPFFQHVWLSLLMSSVLTQTQAPLRTFKLPFLVLLYRFCPGVPRSLHKSRPHILSITYDHIHLKTRDPVRSPIDKQVRARLVLGSVTTGESLVLYVFFLFFICNGFFISMFGFDSSISNSRKQTTDRYFHTSLIRLSQRLRSTKILTARL